MSTIYRLTAQKQRVLTRFELNDVPLWIWNNMQSVHVCQEVNPWIVPGVNTLRARVDWPEEESYVPGVARASARIETSSPLPTGNASEMLADYAWPPKDEKEGKEEYPSEAVLEFDVAEVPPSSFWPRAEPIDLSPAGEREIIDLVGRLHAAMATRDVDRLVTLLDYRAADIARTRYWPETKGRELQREFFHETLIEEPEWELEPLRAEELDLHFVADGRLLWVTREDFQPALAMTAGDEGEVAVNLYLAPVDGKWTVIR